MATQLGTMVSNVLVKLSDTGTTRYYTNGEVKKAIGDSYRYYTMPLIESGQGYFETTANLNTVANTQTVSIASLNPEFWRVSQLFRRWSDSLIPLERDEERWTTINLSSAASGSSWVPKYKMQGRNLVFNPLPGSTETGALKLDYVYVPTFPNSSSADSFTFDTNFPTIYEVNVEIRAAIKCMESKDAVGGISDIATFRAELADLDRYFVESLDTDELPDRVQYTGPSFRFL